MQSINTKLIFQMNPEELMDFFAEEIKIVIPENIDNEENRRLACEEMNKATSYTCYLKEMEERAKLIKRSKKKRRKFS